MARRIYVDVRTEQEQPLEWLARDGHRSVREHASYLLYLKIQEELETRAQAEPVTKAG